ncbi:YicC/YloC family endoribonuclease [Pedobacter heparinus]|uniref:YicC domain protein n=1 Tax=Pedobacter heparinus (strain ATCC 13125 / DSM 2366 / CIP 104194 / JCM 7457 / NBRC 12017 / NCIMB 9290 / NRRL B-14731 / HIM 762-3) TaxID=485917 RepID=C6XX81_PEDHD|nr:YicC/YloC family endoribonuclease [Pedobacter heparinus]ACU06387.1 YicC domain protein [Pedobacter heparinus DSM 2366]
MTGYGLASADHENVKFAVEIKSLNSKFLELNLKLPKAFSDKELLLRNICSKEIERGKVSVSINLERGEEALKGASINAALLSRYYRQLEAINTSLGANSTNLLQAVLNFPEVISYTEDEVSENDWVILFDTFNKALASFNQFRETEGNVLKTDLELRIKNILEFFGQIEVLEPLRIPQIRSRLNQFLEDNVGKLNVDQNRLEQELIYYIDKLDITEEKIRLKSHCDYFIETLKSKDANGKKLGFISQEIGREINTMGAKANDAQIQQLVVGMKEELEKIKEQLLNVL